MRTPRFSVVIPTLNEAGNLPSVLPRLPEDTYEVIIVDGQSTDGTVDVARRLLPTVRIVEQEAPGKGAALRSGFAAARGDIIVTLDADGSTDPREIPVFVNALVAGADFVKGSRFLHGAGTADMSFVRRLGNHFFTVLVRILFGGRYTDLCYGYNAFWRSVLPLLELDGDGFEIETEMNIRALRLGLRVQEVPSYEALRLNGESRLRALPDGIRVLRTILRESRLPISANGLRRERPGLVPVPIQSRGNHLTHRGVLGSQTLAGALYFNGVDAQLNTSSPADTGGIDPSAATSIGLPAAGVGISPLTGDGRTNGHVATNGDARLPMEPDIEAGTGSRVLEHAPRWTIPIFDEYVYRLTDLLSRVDRASVDGIVERLRAARDAGATVFVAGNGGSSATAAHWVNDLTKGTRRPGQRWFRAIGLTDNVPWLTALANDEGYVRVFSGQLENLGRPGDMLVVISASGNSPNVLSAIQTAHALDMSTVGLLGFDGGKALSMVQHRVLVETEPGAYGLVESAHSAVTDIITKCLATDVAVGVGEA